MGRWRPQVEAKDQTGSWWLRHPAADRDGRRISAAELGQARSRSTSARSAGCPMRSDHPTTSSAAHERRPRMGRPDRLRRQSGGVRHRRPVTRPRSFPTACRIPSSPAKRRFDSVAQATIGTGMSRLPRRIQRHVARRHRAGPRQPGLSNKASRPLGSPHGRVTSSTATARRHIPLTWTSRPRRPIDARRRRMVSPP